MELIFFLLFSLSPPSLLPCLWLFIISVWQAIKSSRRWPRRRNRLLPTPFLHLPPHLPPRPMPAKWCWLRLLLAGSQSGGDAKWQPVVADWTFLSSPAGTRCGCPPITAERQLQLRKSERWTANPSGAASRSTTSSAADDQPSDSELEGQRPSGGAQGRVTETLDTGTHSLMFNLL